MKNSLFPSFPFNQFPAGDSRLNSVVKRFGGWLRVLDPKHPPPQTLLSELKRIGYSSEGLEAMRTLVGTNEREKMILRAGYLKFRIRQSAPNPLHQAEWSNIEPQLIAYGISDEEIEYAAVHRIPQIKGWLFSETG